MGFPTQRETDYRDPLQRFVWAFRGIDYNGFPFQAPLPVFEGWSQHLSRCGFVHLDQVIAAIDPETGVIDLDKLPEQEIHYQPPVRGQDHGFNGSGEWVPIDQPLEAPVVNQVALMTPQERAMLAEQLREAGEL